MSVFSAPNLSDNTGTTGAQVEQTWVNRKVFIPRSWILQDDVAETITLQVKLPGSTIDRIEVKIWNKRHLIVHAACDPHNYKFHYQIPQGARKLCTATFASQPKILTCQLKTLNPVCVFCHTSSPRRPIPTKDEIASVYNGFEFVQPRHSIIYDGNMALFEAHLEECKDASQINFHIVNNKLVILGNLSPQHYNFLGLRFDCSADCKWDGYFDPKMKIFTCDIPLLGHYECAKCLAKRHDQGSEGTCKEKSEKVVGTQMEKASKGYVRHTGGQDVEISPITQRCSGFHSAPKIPAGLM